MATDYKKINEKSRINLRSLRDQPGDKTHFVYELVQNADDSKSKQLELHLCEKELLVWNDGYKFREEDVLRISSIGFSDKDLTQIGNFGTGFKAVYNYTDRPEVYSGDERFCLPDPTSTSKTVEDFTSLSLVEGIDEVAPRIAKLVEEGKTVFRLPFKENLRQKDLTLLKNQLRKLLKKRTLLFLPHLEMIQWHDISNGQTGTYCRCPYGKIQSAAQVELKASMNDETPKSDKFLVFSKKFQPPQDVINEVLQMEYDEERRKGIQETGEKLQPIEVAFKLQDDRITSMNGCVLFAYLPTEKETHLRFLIQARYQTNPARNDIEKTDQNPWNRWLVETTAKFLPEILEQLKDGGLLEPAFFNVLPLDGEVENDFKPIAEALQKLMQERAFVPTQSGGYAKAKNVFYPHHGSLRKLVDCSWIYPNSSWLHTGIGRSGRVFEVMKEAGVKEINVSHVLDWLKKQDNNWFESRCEEWLRSLYVYLKDQKSHLEHIKQLPLIRLENGRHVCASEAFFPPETDEEHEEIAPFLNELPILQPALLEGEDGNDVKDFLDDLGVEMPHPENLINKSICPLYNQPHKPLKRKNRWHVRYIFESWQRVEGFERRRLEESVSEVPILRAYKGTQRETSNFVVPCNAYLPQAYTGDNDLETYFSVFDGAPWFVDDKYLTKHSDTKAWFQFLKAIGTMDTPRVIKMDIPVDNEEFSQRSIRRYRITRTGEETIEDHSLYGLSVVLNEIREHRNMKLSQVLWSLLVKALPLAEQERETFFKETYKGTYRSKYRSNSYIESYHFDAEFYRDLKSVEWILGKQGRFHIPAKCFLPTDDNRKVLGDNVPYLPLDFDISTRPARWLAKKLDVRLEADVDNVLNYLQTLSQESQKEASIGKIEPIYKFLESESEDADLSRFEKERLIFTPEPKPRWWRTNEVFWEDESAVFGDDRGYLKAHYSEDLKSFFTDSLEVQKRADTLHYISGLQDITSKAQAGDKEIRDRVQKLYRCVWQSLQENGDSLGDEEWQEEWEQLQKDACWLGKEGDEWKFYLLEKLVWNDHNYCAEVVEGEVPFWAFGDDLLEFAKYLGVEGCYQASNIEVDCYSDQGECTIESEKVQKLVPYIHDFLNSTPWRGVYSQEETAEILDRLSVRQAQKLEVSYKLKGKSVPDRTPRQSSLDPKSQGTILWLGLGESEGAYPDLIGDALQEHFGINELREFIKDLLLTTYPHKTTLLNWERRGFEPDRCLSPPDLDSKEGDENASESVDEELPDEKSVEDYSRTEDSESETPTVHEGPEAGNEGSDSTEDKYGAPVHRPPPSRGGARWPGGSGGSTPNRNTGTGYGGGGRGEGEKHRSLKEYLAANPSLFGEGLKLIDTEYRFGSGDEADILFEDSSGNPVTVEVKPPILSGSDQEVWQAVKYKHLAAVKYGLPCEQVRSILAAPEIPDDVKAKCEELGIEPFEVPQE